jgi:hypothetical protein
MAQSFLSKPSVAAASPTRTRICAIAFSNLPMDTPYAPPRGKPHAGRARTTTPLPGVSAWGAVTRL